MSFYSNLASTASRLLTKYGQQITVKSVTGSSINPVTGATVAGTTKNNICNGIFKPYPDNMIDGSRILKSDRMVILDDTYEPQISDTVTIQSQDWSIVDITTSSPAGTALVYFVQIRK